MRRRRPGGRLGPSSTCTCPPLDGPGLLCRASRSAAATRRRPARRLPNPPQVVRAFDLLVYQVLGHEQEPLRDLNRSVLLPLEQARGGAAPLLHTLRTYLACSAVTTLTAKGLHLSVLVTYRLQRVRTLTGRNITLHDDRFDFDAALRGAVLLDWPARAL